jgi:hypothetical protein
MFSSAIRNFRRYNALWQKANVTQSLFRRIFGRWFFYDPKELSSRKEAVKQLKAMESKLSVAQILL